MGWSFTHTLKHKHAQVSREKFPHAGSLTASIPVVDSLTCSKYCRVSTTWSRKMPPKRFLSFSEVACSLVASWSSSTWKRMWKPWVLYNKKKGGRKHKTTKDNIKHQLLSKTKLRSLELGKRTVQQSNGYFSHWSPERGNGTWKPLWTRPHPTSVAGLASPTSIPMEFTFAPDTCSECKLQSRNFVLSQRLYRPITWHLTALSRALENADWISSLFLRSAWNCLWYKITETFFLLTATGKGSIF